MLAVSWLGFNRKFSLSFKMDLPAGHVTIAAQIAFVLALPDVAVRAPRHGVHVFGGCMAS